MNRLLWRLRELWSKSRWAVYSLGKVALEKGPQSPASGRDLLEELLAETAYAIEG